MVKTLYQYEYDHNWTRASSGLLTSKSDIASLVANVCVTKSTM